jgi:Ala-tRNA(Pro) deacylase
MDASSQFKDSLPTTPESLLAVLTRWQLIMSRIIIRLCERLKMPRPSRRYVRDSYKNLYLRDRKKRNFLIVAQEDRVIDLKTLDQKIGSDRLSFGSADRLFEMLGVRPGAVSPLTVINDSDHKVSAVS